MVAQIARREVILESDSFDPKAFLGSKWSISGGDNRNIGLSRIDLSLVRFNSTLKKGEKSIDGRERHVRLLREGDILLGAEFFYELWRDHRNIPEEWCSEVGGKPRCISFDGSYLYGPPKIRFISRRVPVRYVLCLVFGSDVWGWCTRPIDEPWQEHQCSAVLPWNYKHLVD